MNTPTSKPVAPLRGPLAGVSALLVVSLFLGASINARSLALPETGQGIAGQRVAVRQLTTSLARAVRNLVDQHKPCVPAPMQSRAYAAAEVRHGCPTEQASPPRVPMLRSALLDLPPPRA